MATPETKVKKAIREYLDSLGDKCWHVTYMTVGYGKRGVPDILICYRGVFVALEVKRDADHRPTDWQRREIAAIIEAGGHAEVVWSVEQVAELLSSIHTAVDSLSGGY